MEVEKLFKGIAVIVDDQINEKGSSISNIRLLLEEKNIPVLVYDDVPSVEIVDSLNNVAFIILDWEYISTALLNEFQDERVSIPAGLKDEKEGQLLNFIKEIITKIFVPIFIFTALDPEKIKSTLRENQLWSDVHPNRIFVQQKENLNSADNLFGAIEAWVKEMPSAYVLKKWEQTFNKAKNGMFLEMYSYSPNWVKIIWDMLKRDSAENQQEFGEFVTRNLINRIDDMNFDEEYLDVPRDITAEELAGVIEGERYITYKEMPNQAYTGDLFYKDDTYYLNIRAQCDLSRKPNPELYCIKGQLLTDADIVTEDIKLTTDGKLSFSSDKMYSLEELYEVCKSEDKIGEFNQNFINHRDGRFFSNGVILERGPEVIIACVAGKKVIKFRMDIKNMKFNQLKEYRIGRILPPYITRIQQRCAQHIIREGTMPIPVTLFDN